MPHSYSQTIRITKPIRYAKVSNEAWNFTQFCLGRYLWNPAKRAKASLTQKTSRKKRDSGWASGLNNGEGRVEWLEGGSGWVRRWRWWWRSRAPRMLPSSGLPGNERPPLNLRPPASLPPSGFRRFLARSRGRYKPRFANARGFPNFRGRRFDADGRADIVLTNARFRRFAIVNNRCVLKEISLLPPHTSSPFFLPRHSRNCLLVFFYDLTAVSAWFLSAVVVFVIVCRDVQVIRTTARRCCELMFKIKLNTQLRLFFLVY